MPLKIPGAPQGLSTHSALNRLVHSIEEQLQARPEGWKEAVKKSFSTRNVYSLFPWPSTCFGLLFSILLFLCSFGPSNDDWLWHLVEGLIVLSVTLFNVGLNILEQRLRALESKARVEHVVKRLRQVKDQIFWTPANYPHLHTPLTDSIVLQWTIRDKKHVNLPWALLVERDLILLKPGQAAPGLCHSFDDPKIKIKHGEILHIQTHSQADISPTPEFKTPALPQIFVMDETPYVKVVKKVLKPRDQDRPPSVLFKYSHLFFNKGLVQVLLPIVLILSFVVGLAKYKQSWGFTDAADWIGLLLLHPVAVTAPLLPLMFPIAWTVANYTAFAWVLGVYRSSRHLKMTDDPFDDTLDKPEKIRSKNKTSLKQMRQYFVSAFFGKGEYLSRTENLVHTLGTLTALCCTDKKGILAWPNASPEKIFVVKKAAKPDNGGSCLVPEILTVTHDHHNPFKVEFDDPNWREYMNFLKPLGLGILLNTCNISTEEKYTNFFNHLVCESMKAGDQEEKNHAIDMLPIVTRGCICELAMKIGFSSRIISQYTLTGQIQTFRHVQPSLNDKFARNLSLARLKFPFPHLVSVVVQHRTTGSRQLISQGTTDIVLDSCTDCWSGNDLEVLTEDLRKKIMDFYHRASLSSYCTAFALRPHTFPLPWKNCREYLQLPTHSNPFYWQYNEISECVDADTVTSHISAGTKTVESESNSSVRKDDLYIKTKDDAMICLELECNQTFLGMIQLQYQAVVEVVQLIDLLEKACIRFVHFSKENELRSRVFSEKMGLESGWNCHISLKSNTKKKPRDLVTCKTDGNPMSPLVGSVHNLVSVTNAMGSSMPAKLNRPAWFLDFPKWQEIKGNWTNGNNSSVNLLDQDDRNPSPPRNMDSRHASVNSDSDPFEYDMSNRAQLPRGIENIRPHLETMDNVPLLVSLFTDCTPTATTEMVKIMQDYGEVVCVMGSSANYRNIGVFLQSDASFAIEPRYPQLCQRVPVSSPTKGGPSPVAISQLLNSVASSLSFKMDDEISIFHLILESRHFCRSLINSMKFWICCLMTISFLQFTSVTFTLPSFLSLGQTLWISLVFVPLLSLSLIGSPAENSVMGISTGKNILVTNSETFKYALWCYGTRFLPSIGILGLCHLLNIIDLVAACKRLEESQTCSSLTARANVDQFLNFVFLFTYLVFISMSFIHRGHQLWQRYPGTNRAWLVIVTTLTVLCLMYGLFSLATAYPYQLHLPEWYSWAIWILGMPLVVAINEVVKRFEIKVEVRYQKRERLEFGTKLGMNSPF